MVRMYVRDPNTCQATHNVLDLGKAVAAGELAQSALPAIQQHAPPPEAIDVDGGDVAVLGGHCSPCAQKDNLQLFFICLLAHKAWLAIANLGSTRSCYLHCC